MTNRKFYGLYLKDERIASAIELIRLLSQTDYYRTTHITVRGHIGTINIEKYQNIINEDNLIHISSPDYFFNYKQNTIFLSCNVNNYNKIVHKEDYQDGKPHITLYDGEDRFFAVKLFETVNKYKWNIFTQSKSFNLLQKKELLSDFLIFKAPFTFKLYKEIIGNELDFNEIKSFDFKSKLVLIDKICRYITNLGVDYNVNNETYEPQLLAG